MIFERSSPVTRPHALIIRTSGTNCDAELAYAFTLAGADALTLHINRLIEDPSPINRAQLIGFPGGFSYGDDIAAGRIFANRLRHRLSEPLKQAVGRGVAIIGVCNGFQVLAKLGLLPDPQSTDRSTSTFPPQTLTLADNITGRFIDQWVGLRVEKETNCIWTRGLREMELPIAHGEGRFVPGSQRALRLLERQRQVVLRYENTTPNNAAIERPPDDDTEDLLLDGNPNGSVGAIAGICDPSGLILGLMPHPERYTHATHHPRWARHAHPTPHATPTGLQLFQNAVAYARGLREPSGAIP